MTTKAVKTTILFCFILIVPTLGIGQKVDATEKTLAGLTIAADIATTRWGITNHVLYEANPLSKPFMANNAISTAYFGLSYGGLLVANHKLANHPRWRHAINWGVIAGETYLSIRNARIDGRR